VRLEDYAGARKLLEPISHQSSEPHIKHEAEVLLARLQDFEEQRNPVERARRQNRATLESVPEETRWTGEISEAPVMKRKKPATALPSGSPPEPTLQLHPPKGDKAAGILVRIDCHDNGVTFVVKSAGKTLRLHTADPEKILLYKESGDSLGTISMNCGDLSAPSPVVATYRQPATTPTAYDAILLSILFVNK
jgi:hypothetical protein